MHMVYQQGEVLIQEEEEEGDVFAANVDISEVASGEI
jgi:hypothetical protein